MEKARENAEVDWPSELLLLLVVLLITGATGYENRNEVNGDGRRPVNPLILHCARPWSVAVRFRKQNLCGEVGRDRRGGGAASSKPRRQLASSGLSTAYRGFYWKLVNKRIMEHERDGVRAFFEFRLNDSEWSRRRRPQRPSVDDLFRLLLWHRQQA